MIQVADSQVSPERLIGLIDLTDLNDDSTAADVEALCDAATRYGVAGVCVWPDFVAIARERLAQDRGDAIGKVTGHQNPGNRVDDAPTVDVVTVVNFPTGDERPFVVAAVAERSIDNGADEIDVVLPYRRFVAGDHAWCAQMLDAVRDVVGDRIMKVILETGELVDDGLIRAAAAFAIDHGADFIKTSTGTSAVSATPAAFATMVDVVAAAERPVGLKPSGGIRTRADAETYVSIAEEALGEGWATPATFRFGASGLLDDLAGGA